jgi:hypothetical protein
MRDRLLKAKQKGSVVCVSRSDFDGGRELGEVVLVGSSWFLLRIIDDSIRYDGFGAMRIADLSRLDVPHRYADFVARALQLRAATPPAAPALELASPEQLLASACAAARLVSIHWEDVAPDECSIGRLESVDGKEFSFREVNPSARWNRDLALHEFRHLTRIDLLRGYEEALADVLFEHVN